ncbi:MAG: hypothetical protein KGP29_04360 [Proteobacteria bacterium]|nr:hypothetical protein [Pseudomonadota bacterium]
MFKSKSLLLFSLLALTSCALSGRSNDKSVSKYITGATKVGEIKDVHVINVFRAIGTPNNTVSIDKFKYYQWDYSRLVGVSTILGGGTTTFYCKLSAETQNNKIKTFNWYGNQCDIFLDRIKEYFQDKLNIAIISDEEIKQQNTAPGTKAEKLEMKPEAKVEAPAVIEPTPQKTENIALAPLAGEGADKK